MNRTGIHGYSEPGLAVLDFRRVVLTPFDNDIGHSFKLKPDIYSCNHCKSIIYYDDTYFKVNYGDLTSKNFCEKCYKGLCYGY